MVYIGAAHYGLEIFADLLGLLVGDGGLIMGLFYFLSDYASTGIFAAGAVGWGYYAYQLYDYYSTNSAWPSTSNVILTRLALLTAPVISQLIDPVDFDVYSTLIITVGGCYYLYTAYTDAANTLVGDSTRLFIYWGAALVYMFLL